MWQVPSRRPVLGERGMEPLIVPVLHQRSSLHVQILEQGFSMPCVSVQEKVPEKQSYEWLREHLCQGNGCHSLWMACQQEYTYGEIL